MRIVDKERMCKLPNGTVYCEVHRERDTNGYYQFYIESVNIKKSSLEDDFTCERIAIPEIDSNIESLFDGYVEFAEVEYGKMRDGWVGENVKYLVYEIEDLDKLIGMLLLSRETAYNKGNGIDWNEYK